MLVAGQQGMYALCWRHLTKLKQLHLPAGLQLPVDLDQLHALVSKQASCCPDVRVDCAGVHGRHAAAACRIVGAILLLSLLLLLQLLLFYVSLVLHCITQHLVGLEALCVHERASAVAAAAGVASGCGSLPAAAGLGSVTKNVRISL
jgi:hypothetical protein